MGMKFEDGVRQGPAGQWVRDTPAAPPYLALVVEPGGPLTAVAWVPRLGTIECCQAYTAAGLPELLTWLVARAGVGAAPIVVECLHWPADLAPAHWLGLALGAVALGRAGGDLAFADPVAAAPHLGTARELLPEGSVAAVRALAHLLAWDAAGGR